MLRKELIELLCRSRARPRLQEGSRKSVEMARFFGQNGIQCTPTGEAPGSFLGDRTQKNANAKASQAKNSHN
jgi:hypothetical protein